MAENPKRRWFGFSLRTFFVAVAVLGVCCAWVAYESEIVRERRAVLDWLGEPLVIDVSPGPLPVANWTFKTSRTSSWKQWLGEDDTLVSAFYRPNVTQDEIERVKAAFPEATVEPWPE